MLSSIGAFHKYSLIVTCYIFGRFEIRTLTPNRFKNETHDTFAPLGHNYNHQRGFLKLKIVTLHRCGFKLKFPKHCYFDRYFEYINEIAVTKNQNNIGSDDYVSIIALLQSFYFTQKFRLSYACTFHKNSLNTLAVIAISGKHYR